MHHNSAYRLWTSPLALYRSLLTLCRAKRLCAAAQPYERPPKRTAQAETKAGLPPQRTAHSHNSFADTVYDYMHSPPSQAPKPST